MITKIKEKAKAVLSLSIVKEMSFYGSSQIIVQIASFLGASLVGRYFGPANLGLYSFTQDYILAFFAVVIGFNFYFSFEIAKSDSKIKEIKEFIWNKFYVTLFLVFLANITAFFFLSRTDSLLVLFMSAPMLLHPLSAFPTYATSNKLAKLSSTVTITGALISLLLKAYFVYIKAPLTYFVFVGGLDIVLVNIIFLFYFLYKKDLFKDYNKYKRPSLKNTFDFIYKVRFDILFAIAWLLLLRTDKLVLKFISTPHDLGIYSAALKIAEVPNVLAGVMYTALISRLHSVTDKNDSRLQKSFIFYLLSSVLCVVGIMIFAPLAIQIVFGEKYKESVEVLRVYSLTVVPMFMAYYYISLYGANKKSNIMTMVFGLSVVLNIFLVALFTPVWGLKGTATATFIAYSFGVLTLSYFKKSFLK